jgi:hypothetical protein
MQCPWTDYSLCVDLYPNKTPPPLSASLSRTEIKSPGNSSDTLLQLVLDTGYRSNGGGGSKFRISMLFKQRKYVLSLGVLPVS